MIVDPGRRRWLFGRSAARMRQPSPTGIPLIGESCLARRNVVCRSCGDECDEGAIRFRPVIAGVAVPTLDPARCNGCGECVRVCPAAAIAIAASATGCVLATGTR